MPQHIKSSITTAARSAKAKQVMQAATKKTYKCHINGCDSGPFQNSTDLSRHKWVHLPRNLRPTCPFEGPDGQRCSHNYIGRNEYIKLHWEKCHPLAGPFPSKFQWPKLNKILAENNLKLGEDNPRTSAPCNSNLPAPAPSLPPAADGPSPVGNYYNVPWSFHQHPLFHAQGYNPQNVPSHFVPQEFLPPTSPTYFANLEFPALPHSYQYLGAPMFHPFFYGVYPAVDGQHVPNTFNVQVEGLGLDDYPGDQYALPNDLEHYMTDEVWNSFLREEVLN